MPNQQLVDYIKAQLAAGALKPDIKKAVATAGWPLADIERAFMAAERPAAKAAAPVIAHPQVQPQVQPQPIHAQPLVQPQPQEKPLPVIHMHPQEGLLRSGWFWSLIVLLLLVGGAAATYFYTPVGVMITSYLNPAPSMDASLVATTTPPLGKQTYSNMRYGYTFSYPGDWTMEPETQVVDTVNKMPSVVVVRDASKTRMVAVIVNEREWLLKNETPLTASTTIAGLSQTAYMFPDGYECLMANPEATDCSFFVIPIKYNGVWYELRASGDAEAITETYKGIFDTFAFTASTSTAASTTVQQ